MCETHDAGPKAVLSAESTHDKDVLGAGFFLLELGATAFRKERFLEDNIRRLDQGSCPEKADNVQGSSRRSGMYQQILANPLMSLHAIPN